MGHESISAQMPPRNSVAFELPYASNGHLKVRNSEPQRLFYERTIKNTGCGSKTTSTRSVYGAMYFVTTYGMDPMVSKASVIHELVHERQNNNVFQTNPCRAYPVQKEYMHPQVDLRI